ncbi:MAG TPA: thioredoxin-disulfide reductase [Thermoanaerobaculia bacterium]|nr:thioredoxin-disulfide reductase [Thermoanaerobaculia bacterium]
MPPSKSHYRVAIVGSGPAGWTAALYASRAELAPVVFEGPQPGGQLTITTEVENYPGYRNGVQGPEMMEDFKEQAKRFGTEAVLDTVTDVEFGKRPFRLGLDAGSVTADAVIVSTGATAKLLGIASESKFMGHGVSACATCDGFFFKGKEVAVVGGGDTAMEESTFLTKFATKVTIVHRSEKFRASKIMLDRARKNPKIAWKLNAGVEEVHGGEGGITALTLKDTRTNQTSRFETGGLFIAIGHSPNTAIFKGKLEMNEVGYLKIKHPSTQTSVEGVFAAGDVADPTYRQAVSAAGEGCKAAMDAERWLAAQGIHGAA